MLTMPQARAALAQKYRGGHTPTPEVEVPLRRALAAAGIANYIRKTHCPEPLTDEEIGALIGLLTGKGR